MAEILKYPVEHRTFVKGKNRIDFTYHPTTKRVLTTTGSPRMVGDQINALHLLLRDQGWEMADGIQTN